MHFHATGPHAAEETFQGGTEAQLLQLLWLEVEGGSELGLGESGAHVLPTLLVPQCPGPAWFPGDPLPRSGLLCGLERLSRMAHSGVGCWKGCF